MKRIEEDAWLYFKYKKVWTLPEGLEYLGAFPPCDELWLPSTLTGMSQGVLDDLQDGKPVVIVDGHSAAADYLVANGVSPRFTSTAMKAPEGSLYQGDSFALQFDQLIHDKGYEEVSAVILQNNTVIRSASYSLTNQSTYMACSQISSQLEFETLPIGEGYVFRLNAMMNGSVRTLVETSFCVVDPPVRYRLRNVKFPEGIVSRDETFISGDVICNYPASTVEVIIMSRIGGLVERIHKTYSLPEEYQLSIPLASVVESDLPDQLENGKFYLTVRISVPSRNVSFDIVNDQVFWLVTSDGATDEQTLGAVYAFVTNMSANNIAIFEPYYSRLREEITKLDWTDILKMSVNGRWEIAESFLFEGGSDAYMAEFCKAQVLKTLDDLVHRNKAEYIRAYDALQLQLLSYLKKGNNKVKEYIKEHGAYNGDTPILLEPSDWKILENIDELNQYFGDLSQLISDWDKIEEGFYDLQSYLAADYTIQVGILNSVLDSIGDSSNRTAVVRALKEVKAQLSDKYVYMIVKIGEELIHDGEEYIRARLLFKPAPLVVLTDLAIDRIMSETGWAEDAEDDMNLLAWYQNSNVCITAYRESFQRILDGDTSGTAISNLILTFTVSKECLSNALEAIEGRILEEEGNLIGFRELESRLRNLKIPDLPD